MGLGVAYQKTTFRTKILVGVWAKGASKKIWDPLFISATAEASNFKFGTQLGLGSSLPRNNFYDQYWRGSGLGEYRKKLGSHFISATVEASNFKFGIGGLQVGIGE